MFFKISGGSALSFSCARITNHGHFLRRKYFCSMIRHAHTNSHGASSSSSGGKKSQGASSSSCGGKKSQGNFYLLPGATAATLIMLGVLHSRRMYNDKQYAQARERGEELEFSPDLKATFLRMLPLRSISRGWGALTSIELPVWMRSYVYYAWARAFHSDLDEAALPLESYASLREFFVRSLREGCRPINSDPNCLACPVDGIVLRCGKLEESGGFIEQVKGFSYSVSSLLGGNSLLPLITEGGCYDRKPVVDERKSKSWWRLSLASPEIRSTIPSSPVKGLYYCVIYLRPGDYHHIHSPTNWTVLVRRHFSGNLFPVNERATRTIRNLYVENERVVLEGSWREGFMAMAAIGATNVGSIELYIEPELRTNKRKKYLARDPPDELFYEPGVGIPIEKGQDVGAFNMGSTVVLIFHASHFKFDVERGHRVLVGQALGTSTR